MPELTLIILTVALLWAAARLQSMAGMLMWVFVILTLMMHETVSLHINFFWLSVIVCSLVLAMAQLVLALYD